MPMSLADPAMMQMKLGMFRIDLALVKDKTVADAAVTSIEDIAIFIRFFALFFHRSIPFPLHSLPFERFRIPALSFTRTRMLRRSQRVVPAIKVND
jgi:hypothetical protein